MTVEGELESILLVTDGVVGELEVVTRLLAQTENLHHMAVLEVPVEALGVMLL